MTETVINNNMYYIKKGGNKIMPAETDEYNGNPVIILKRDENDRYPFRFGVKKAQLVIDNIDSIKKFVKENTQ